MTAPNLPTAPKDYNREDEQRTRSLIRDALTKLFRPLRNWKTSGADNSMRTFDANTATPAETAKALAQLIEDLKEKGTLG